MSIGKRGSLNPSLLNVSRELKTDFSKCLFVHNTQEITDVMVSQLAGAQREEKRGERKAKKRVLIAFL